jgi:hypothetical protein
LNNLDTLQKLHSEKLVSTQADIKFLGQLCENKILTPPNREKPFYHDDIIRRILYLDLAFGTGKDHEHLQKVHQCARSLYRFWIEAGLAQYSLHFFFAEWLFHTLQVTDLTDDMVFFEWRSLLSLIQPVSLTVNDIQQVIREQLESDNEIVYLYRERFGSENLSLLFAS